jgi:molecular chaperone GrpE
MDSNHNSQNAEELSDEFQFDDSTSIEDFIKELEAKEKDLRISPQMVIEIDEPETGIEISPEFFLAELAAEKQSQNAALPLASPANHATVANLENQVAQLQTQISKNETDHADLVKMLQRRQSDFENYKKRVERERSDTFLNQLSNLAMQMLPVLDNMNRALDSASSFSEEKLQNFQHFFDGIVLVSQQLNEVLAEMGVSPIAAVGERFDPHFHEAVATEETNEVPPHTVTAEFLRGYRIDDRVVRPAMVKVSQSEK